PSFPPSRRPKGGVHPENIVPPQFPGGRWPGPGNRRSRRRPPRPRSEAFQAARVALPGGTGTASVRSNPASSSALLLFLRAAVLLVDGGPGAGLRRLHGSAALLVALFDVGGLA